MADRGPGNAADAKAAQPRAALADELRSRGVICSEPVASAFSTVAREGFLPEVLAEQGLEAVYQDQAYLIKQDRRGMPLSSSSQPTVMAEMLELLDLRPGHRVLEVGAGSGYNAALMAHIVGRTGSVTSIDIDPRLASRARAALRAAGLPAKVVVGDGRAGYEKEAPYDRIIVTASATDIPRAWLEQLVEGGRMVLPLRLDPDADAVQSIPVLERRGRHLHSLDMTWGAFMPLHGGDGGSQAPRFTLGASRTTAGRHGSLASFSGAALERLPDRTARRLLGAALDQDSPPRSRGFTPLARAHMPILIMYLFCKIEPSQRVWARQSTSFGIGILDASAPGLAVVTVPSVLWAGAHQYSSRAPWQLRSYGMGDAACERMRSLIADWRGLGPGARRTPHLTGTSRGRATRLRLSWS